MTRRYFAPDLPHSGGLVALPDAEAQHATRVMRVQTGDVVTLFDGKGSESQAVVVHVGRNECQCDAEPSAKVDREPSREIHLGIALPKPDRARELIERLTELGVKTVTPLVAERTQRPASDSVIEKLRRGVIEACKQCGRNELMQILPNSRADDFFAASSPTQRWIAHQSPQSMPLEAAKASSVVLAAVGPEGGWTDDEIRLASEHGFESVHLGSRIYRIETAATVIASLLAESS